MKKLVAILMFTIIIFAWYYFIESNISDVSEWLLITCGTILGWSTACIIYMDIQLDRQLDAIAYCNCYKKLTIKESLRHIKEEVVEFIKDPSMDELSDIGYSLNRLLGTLCGGKYISLFGDSLHVKKINERVENTGCIRSENHKCKIQPIPPTVPTKKKDTIIEIDFNAEETGIEHQISGIQCDNEDCDFVDDTASFEEYEKWLNKPCPKCGYNLLTLENLLEILETSVQLKLLNGQIKIQVLTDSILNKTCELTREQIENELDAIEKDVMTYVNEKTELIKSLSK